MEANPNELGIILNTLDEVIIVRDAFDCLMDPESREDARNVERERKFLEYGLEVVGIPGGVPPEEQQYAKIAETGFDLFSLKYDDEILEALQHYEAAQISEMRLVRYITGHRVYLLKFLLGAYTEVVDSELGKKQAEDMMREIDETFAESSQMTSPQQ